MFSARFKLYFGVCLCDPNALVEMVLHMSLAHTLTHTRRPSDQHTFAAARRTSDQHTHTRTKKPRIERNSERQNVNRTTIFEYRRLSALTPHSVPVMGPKTARVSINMRFCSHRLKNTEPHGNPHTHEHTNERVHKICRTWHLFLACVSRRLHKVQTTSHRLLPITVFGRMVEHRTWCWSSSFWVVAKATLFDNILVAWDFRDGIWYSRRVPL